MSNGFTQVTVYTYSLIKSTQLDLFPRMCQINSHKANFVSNTRVVKITRVVQKLTCSWVAKRNQIKRKKCIMQIGVGKCDHKITYVNDNWAFTADTYLPWYSILSPLDYINKFVLLKYQSISKDQCISSERFQFLFFSTYIVDLLIKVNKYIFLWNELLWLPTAKDPYLPRKRWPCPNIDFCTDIVKSIFGYLFI